MASRPQKAAKSAARTYGEASRASILNAAQNLFARRGLQQTSMQDIADAAGVSRATVFNHFHSKQLVLDAITARSLIAYRDILDRVLADTTTPTPDLLRTLFSLMSDGLEANRDLYKEVFAEIRKTSMGLDGGGESPPLRMQAYDRLVALFHRGQSRGDIDDRSDAEVLATAFDSLLSGAVTQWLHAGVGARLKPMLLGLAEVLIAGAARR